MAAKKTGLGRGLDALFPEKNGEKVKTTVKKENTSVETTEISVKSKDSHGEDNKSVLTVKISKVEPNRSQPRKQFDEDALLELSESIKQYGVLQPLLVSNKKDYYEIVAGERRWRAAKLAGLKEVPVIIKELSDQQVVEISLIENIQREDLNPLEEAEGKKVFLIGGGIGIPPMLETAKQLKAEKTAVLGYRDELFLNDEFTRYADVYVATEDGSAGTKGNVLNAICERGLEAEVIFACGPTPMLRALKEYAAEKNITCWISMEERMACGIGACLGCVCKSKEIDAHSLVHNKRVCKDGPVFLSTEVEL